MNGGEMDGSLSNDDSYMLWCFDNCCYTGTADTPCFNKSVIGGTADIFSGTDNSFIINISNDSFQKGHQVDISVCLDRSHHFEIPKRYKILSQTYQIITSEKLQKSLTITLKHNAIIRSEEEAKSLIILHQNDENKTEELKGYTEPNSSFITFQLKELSPLKIVGSTNITSKYWLSFYRQKNHYDNNPSLKIRDLITGSESKHKVSYTICHCNYLLILYLAKERGVVE